MLQNYFDIIVHLFVFLFLVPTWITKATRVSLQWTRWAHLPVKLASTIHVKKYSCTFQLVNWLTWTFSPKVTLTLRYFLREARLIRKLHWEKLKLSITTLIQTGTGPLPSIMSLKQGNKFDSKYLTKMMAKMTTLSVEL